MFNGFCRTPSARCFGLCYIPKWTIVFVMHWIHALTRSCCPLGILTLSCLAHPWQRFGKLLYNIISRIISGCKLPHSRSSRVKREREKIRGGHGTPQHLLIKAQQHSCLPAGYRGNMGKHRRKDTNTEFPGSSDKRIFVDRVKEQSLPKHGSQTFHALVL